MTQLRAKTAMPRERYRGARPHKMGRCAVHRSWKPQSHWMLPCRYTRSTSWRCIGRHLGYTRSNIVMASDYIKGQNRRHSLRRFAVNTLTAHMCPLKEAHALHAFKHTTMLVSVLHSMHRIKCEPLRIGCTSTKWQDRCAYYVEGFVTCGTVR